MCFGGIGDKYFIDDLVIRKSLVWILSDVCSNISVFVTFLVGKV